MSSERGLGHDDILNILADVRTSPTDIGHMPWRSQIFLHHQSLYVLGNRFLIFAVDRLPVPAARWLYSPTEPVA